MSENTTDSDQLSPKEIASKCIQGAIDKGSKKNITEDGYLWDLEKQIAKDIKKFASSSSSPSSYDSQKDTLLHIKRVAELLTKASVELINRANCHDDSKLDKPEKPLFDKFTPKLKGCSYGSDEYKEYLNELQVALDHHYANNSHHPEHYENGINGFDLFDLIEMFFDWKAASERHDDGDIFRSIEINKDRFNISNQLRDIFRNTAERT